MRSASAGIRAVFCRPPYRRPAMVTPWSSRLAWPRHQCRRISSRRGRPAGEVAAELAAEGDGGAAIVVGGDGLDQRGGPAGRGAADDRTADGPSAAAA